MYFYGDQNKSRWERGGKKNLKKVLIFFQKGVFKGGDQKFFFVPPLNKSPRTPLCKGTT